MTNVRPTTFVLDTEIKTQKKLHFSHYHPQINGSRYINLFPFVNT